MSHEAIPKSSPPQKSGGRWIVFVPGSGVSHVVVFPLTSNTGGIAELIQVGYLDSLRFGRVLGGKYYNWGVYGAGDTLEYMWNHKLHLA